MRAGRTLAIALLVAATAVVVGQAQLRAGTEERIRTIHITVEDSLFTPDTFDVQPGETVRFVVENTDFIDHEFLIGDEAVQRAHEEGTEAHHGAKPGEISLPAHSTRETTYTFPHAGYTLFGCHLPGHYDYGMRGLIVIS